MHAAFTRGDWFPGDGWDDPRINETRFRSEKFRAGDWPSIVVLFPLDPRRQELLVEIDHEQKVLDFNSLNEKMRRRILRMRARSLAAGGEATEWLPTWFPTNGYAVDGHKATIR